MSYADVAASGAPPLSEQPKPDPGLLNTERPASDSLVADDAAKVNVVSNDFKQHPITLTSLADPPVTPDETDDAEYRFSTGGRKKQRRRSEAVQEAEGVLGWMQEQLLRPGVAGGLIGVVNVGLIGFATYHLYTRPHLRSDTKALGTGIGTAFVLLGAEGYAADLYANTPRGRAESRRAKEEGAVLYRHAKETILRPGVLGGAVGLLNLGVLATLGYYSYISWDKPRWDRRVISTVSVGLLTLWGGEGYLAARYSE